MSTPHFPVGDFLASGEPLAVVATEQADEAAAQARIDDWTVLLAHSEDGSSVRTLQAGLAESLDLPGNAATNLDALTDTLRDLPDRAEQGPGVLLVWTPPTGLGLEDDGLATMLDVLVDSAVEHAERGGRAPRFAVLVASDVLVDQLQQDDDGTEGQA